MKKSVSLMVPRSVTQKSKNTKGDHREAGCPRLKQVYNTETRLKQDDTTETRLKQDDNTETRLKQDYTTETRLKQDDNTETRLKQDYTTENGKHIMRETCPQVLSDVTSDTDTHQLSSNLSSVMLPKQSVYRKFSETVSTQKNAPYVNVGAISYNKRIPIYSRNRRSSQNPVQSGTRYYTDIAWEPVKNRQTTRHAYNDSKYTRHGKTEVYHPRKWEYTDTGRQYLHRPVNNRGFEFTVMSYNVLAQNLLEDNHRMYYRSPSYVLKWRHRATLLLKELKYHTPDVICLQEVNCYHYDEFFLPELQYLGYEGTYLKRTGDKLDGCATFYKKRKFDCEQIIQVPYNKPHGGQLLNRDNVGLIVKLKPKSSSISPDKYLVVSNTHLLFNPKRGDVKLAQLMVLLAEIDKCASTDCPGYLYHSVIMCGDFNSLPHSDIYKLIVMGFLDYEELEIRNISGQEKQGSARSSLCPLLKRDFFPSSLGISDSCQYCTSVRHQTSTLDVNRSLDDMLVKDTLCTGVLKHQLRFVSVYKHWISRTDFKEITTHHGKAACTVDYIFYGVRSGLVRYHRDEVQTSNIQESHLNLLGSYQLLSESDLDRMGSLPNQLFGSDHLALIAKFLLT